MALIFLLGATAVLVTLTAPEGQAADARRYKVVAVSGKLSAEVIAGYAAGQCTNGTPSLFSGDIHGRRPGQSVGQQTQYGTIYNDLFRASVKSSRGSFNPGTGRGEIFARIRMPFVTGGTGERIGCGSDYKICERQVRHQRHGDGDLAAQDRKPSLRSLLGPGW